ncbi:MAG: tetratricopeptide repeat protein, partial [Acetobacteraceae bacterium]
QYADALTRLDAAVARDPDNAAAQFHRVTALLHLQRFDEALICFEKAIRDDSLAAASHVNRSHALTKLGRLDDALISIEHALRLEPRQAEAWNDQGNILQNLGRTEASITAYDNAIELKPDFAQACNNRGNALQKVGRYDAAIASYDRAITLLPDYAAAYAHRGIALMAVAAATMDATVADRCREQALAGFQRGAELKPDDTSMHLHRGVALRSLARHEEALIAFARAGSLQPDLADAHYAAGTLLLELGRAKEALAPLRRACALRPDWAEAANALGNARHELGEWDGAIADYDRAITLKPRFAFAFANRGLALLRADRPDEALETLQHAETIDPNLGEAHFNEALVRLTSGDFDLGWQKYEWRHRQPEDRRNAEAFVRAVRAGALNGRAVLLQAEQGYGDTLQFCRYASLVDATGVAVTLDVPQPLVRLIGSSLAGVARVAASGDASAADFDLRCKVMSLPLASETTMKTIPADIPYLHADPGSAAAWLRRLADVPGLRVGVVWSGRRRADPASRAIDGRRSVSLDRFAGLSSVPGVALVSLQKDEAARDTRAPPPGMVIHDWTEKLDDFADTAALIEALDLVISVDTAVAHLAGALGKPVWLLSRFDGCWRWLRDRSDSPWYPTMRIFRQPRPGDWDSVMRDVGSALRRRVACR